MSVSVASTLAVPGQGSGLAQAQSLSRTSARDLRLDFFRGIALLMIFIDHISGNRFAAITLQSMGFADAAEVFVFIAGMAGIYAYRKAFHERGALEGSRLVLGRIRTLYAVHMLMVVGVLVFALAAKLHGTEFDTIGKLGLQPLLDAPVDAFLRLPVLAYMPNYLDILPLYVVLLAALPVIIILQRWHVLLPVGVATGLYGVAQATGLTLPNLGENPAWFLNPFAWLLLFVAGATAARLSLDNVWQGLPRTALLGITAASAVYVVFAFLHAAPWRVFPALETFVALSIALEPDKAFLSWHRLLDLLAKAWLIAVFLPRDAAFMKRGVGEAISRAGRNSLPVFVIGTFLSLVGSVILFETAGATLWQIAVTAGGVILLLAAAAALEAGHRGLFAGTRRLEAGLPVHRPPK